MLTGRYGTNFSDWGGGGRDKKIVKLMTLFQSVRKYQVLPLITELYQVFFKDKVGVEVFSGQGRMVLQRDNCYPQYDKLVRPIQYIY
jgi:hypothetical protein